MGDSNRAVVSRKAIDVAGIVPGVGFRPFVYRLAEECNLTGFVSNTPTGVTIEVQGEPDLLDRFLRRLPAEAPPLAKITPLLPRDAEPRAETAFRILSSRADAPPRALISPDVAVCNDCLREMANARDRRFRYPFINCANCGPRFTIIRDIPYDRSRTSMSSFKMCAACQAEYDDPTNRRFHAQPNACWDCGPLLQLWSADGSLLDVAEPLREAMKFLEKDGIVAVKGLGGFHLTCDARSEAAVLLLRKRKHRVEKPFAVMFRRMEDIDRICLLDEAARKLLLSVERPIVLLPRKPDAVLPESIAPQNRYLGVFLPYTPLHHLIFAAGKFDALVMTSANLNQEPITIDNQEAIRRLQGIGDAYLLHNRDILHRCGDSVVRVTGTRPQIMRRSRGYVPVPVPLEHESEPILAVGGELKNTICIVRGNEAFLGPHVGDTKNVQSFTFFEETIEHLERILDVHPKVVAYDLHPDYFSTKWALGREDVKLIGVQHHHAHIASCMAENHLDGKVIGIALDGTGYGSDGAVWGGEVLVADYRDFERAAHLEYVPLPGGAAAIHEPWRVALSYMVKHFVKDLDSLDLPFFRDVDSRRREVIRQMIERQVQSPRTSSCGRLFDAVAALLRIRLTANYEAQPAIELEMAARESTAEDGYPFDLIPDGAHWQIGTLPLFQAAIQDLRHQQSVAEISRRFHVGLSGIFVSVAEKIRDQSKLNRVCLSGSCFNNALLFALLVDGLRAKSFEVFFHSVVPAGDGGLGLGQAIIAAHQIQAT